MFMNLKTSFSVPLYIWLPGGSSTVYVLLKYAVGCNKLELYLNIKKYFS